MRLGVFDSGKGGVLVAERLRSKGFDVVLLTDSEAFPYGIRSKEFIQKRSCMMTERLQQQGCTTIVIGCNTAAVFATDLLEKKFDLTFFDPLTALGKKLATLKAQSVLSCVTASLCKKEVYKTSLERAGFIQCVQTVNCQDLVDLIEKELPAEHLLQTKINTHSATTFDTLVLGCTHFTTLFPSLRNAQENYRVIDSVEELIDAVEAHFCLHMK